MSQSREDFDLIGYLLDALEESERARVEAALAQDDSLQQELAQLKELFHLLEPARQGGEPPPGLAERTCQRIAAESERWAWRRCAQFSGGPLLDAEGAASLAGPAEERCAPSRWVSGAACAAATTGDASSALAPRPKEPTASSRRRFSEEAPQLGSLPRGWRWPDVLMATAVAGLVLLVVFSGLQQVRFRQEIRHCQENLRQLGQALIHYSEFHQGQFPSIVDGNRWGVLGIYGPILLTTGLVEHRAFWCPGAIRQGSTPVPIPPLDQLERGRPEEWKSVLGQLGGSYGYSLGYVEAGQYRPQRNRHRTYFALLADAPSPEASDLRSLHHGGKGQNVCFEDGHVEFVTGCYLPASNDHFFLNHQGRLAPGIGPEDSVVAPGYIRVEVPSGGPNP